jgi:hypothetical protein
VSFRKILWELKEEWEEEGRDCGRGINIAGEAGFWIAPKKSAEKILMEESCCKEEKNQEGAREEFFV